MQTPTVVITDSESSWRDAVEDGAVIAFDVVDNSYTRGFLYDTMMGDDDMLVYDAIRGGASPEAAYCDGENPSGRGAIHAISPYTTGVWGLDFDNGVLAQTVRGWTPSNVIRDLGLVATVYDTITDSTGALTRLVVLISTPEHRERLLAAVAEG